MELVVRKSDLLRELQLFQGIVERKNTIPVLANVLVEARGDQIELVATDLEVGLRTQCAATVRKPGVITIPAKKLYEIVKALPETDVRIQQTSHGVKVSADQFESKMQTQPHEDFPALPRGAEDGAQTLPAALLQAMVSKTQFAITGEDTRYFLNGALFILAPTTMTLVSTDGHRLALVSGTRQGEGGGPDGEAEVRAILPRKTLWELGKLLGEGQEEIGYERGENHLFFKVGGRTLVSRMIDGQFPAFERVIPKGNNREVEFDVDRLTSAVRRVALLSNERSRAVKFAVDDGKVEVTSSSPEVGEAREVISVEYDAGAMEICFNAQYVLDFLNVVETDHVKLRLKDEVSQAVMEPVGQDGYDYTYVIMPMRV